MQTYGITFRAMGSQVNIWLGTDEANAAILQQVPAWIEAVESSLSRFRPASDLNRLNARVEEWMQVSPTLYAALSAAKRAAYSTNGLVTPLVLPALLAAGYDRSFELLSEEHQHTTHNDPITLDTWETIQFDTSRPRVWLPGTVDLGGTAKGWAAETIADRLMAYGPCLIDLGGDIVARGKPWSVELHDIFQPEIPFATFMLDNCTVATSGTDFRRWGADKHHIIDPRTGKPAVSDLISVTVIHPDAVLAEAFAKAVLLQGSLEGLAWLAQQPDAAGVAFDCEGRVLATENFQDHLT